MPTALYEVTVTNVGRQLQLMTCQKTLINLFIDVTGVSYCRICVLFILHVLVTCCSLIIHSENGIHS